MSTAAVLEALWADFVVTTPRAARIHHLLAAHGERVHHDHAAVWTFGAPGLGMDVLARVFEQLGWRARERHRSADRRVRARAWHHDDPALPRILISEVVVSRLTARAQAIVAGLVGQLPGPPGLNPQQRPWQVTFADYQVLRAESDHAAWVAAFGPRVHHFTIDVSALATFPDLVALDAFLIEHGFPPRADSVEVAFTDAIARIPSGTYERVLRTRVVALEQHVDLDADELNAHTSRGGPSHHRG